MAKHLLAFLLLIIIICCSISVFAVNEMSIPLNNPLKLHQIRYHVFACEYNAIDRLAQFSQEIFLEYPIAIKDGINLVFDLFEGTVKTKQSFSGGLSVQESNFLFYGPQVIVLEGKNSVLSLSKEELDLKEGSWHLESLELSLLPKAVIEQAGVYTEASLRMAVSETYWSAEFYLPFDHAVPIVYFEQNAHSWSLQLDKKESENLFTIYLMAELVEAESTSNYLEVKGWQGFKDWFLTSEVAIIRDDYVIMLVEPVKAMDLKVGFEFWVDEEMSFYGWGDTRENPQFLIGAKSQLGSDEFFWGMQFFAERDQGVYVGFGFEDEVAFNSLIKLYAAYYPFYFKLPSFEKSNSHFYCGLSLEIDDVTLSGQYEELNKQRSVTGQLKLDLEAEVALIAEYKWSFAGTRSLLVGFLLIQN